MDQLKEYKRIIKIHCLSIGDTPNPIHTFQIIFQQTNPHSLFKYTLTKTKDQLMRLFERLQGEIFDFDNPFTQNFLSNLTKPSMKPIDTINVALEECTSRLDILIHHYFLYFFSVHVHYPDFVACVKEEMLALDLCQNKKGLNKGESTQRKVGFDLEKGWLKKQETAQKKQLGLIEQQKISSSKQTKQASQFENLINLLHQQEEQKLQLQERPIIDFTYIKYYETEFLITLQEERKGTKIKSFINTFFNNSKPSGYLSLHRKQANQYRRKFTAVIQAEPHSMQHNTKTNMIMTLTTAGVCVHLLKLQHKNESIEMFAFIPLTGTADITNNCFLGEVYLIRRESPHKLYVFGLKDEILNQTEYKYKNPSSICFQQGNNRLYVSDETGIYIYLVNGGLDIKKLHVIKTDQSYINLSQKLGYLYCINASGILTVIQLKPPQKQQLISITTTIGIPSKTKKIIGSKSQRLIISCFRDCIVLIDTMEGPLNSFKIKGKGDIKAMVYDRETQRLMTITEDGIMTILTINKKIQ